MGNERADIKHQRALLTALACAHDAVTFGERDGQPVQRMNLIRAALALLEVAADYQAACDFDQLTTADVILRWLIGDLAGRDRG